MSQLITYVRNSFTFSLRLSTNFAPKSLLSIHHNYMILLTLIAWRYGIDLGL